MSASAKSISAALLAVLGLAIAAANANPYEHMMGRAGHGPSPHMADQVPPSYDYPPADRAHRHQHQPAPSSYGLPPTGASYQDDTFADIPLGAGPYARAPGLPVPTKPSGMGGPGGSPVVAANNANRMDGRTVIKALRRDLNVAAERLKSNPRVKQAVDKAAPHLENLKSLAMSNYERGSKKISDSLERHRARQAQKHSGNSQQAGAGVSHNQQVHNAPNYDTLGGAAMPPMHYPPPMSAGPSSPSMMSHGMHY